MVGVQVAPLFTAGVEGVVDRLLSVFDWRADQEALLTQQQKVGLLRIDIGPCADFFSCLV